eukprot:5576865-Prymnesium_polylepis.1
MSVVVAFGATGSGKTTIAVCMALEWLRAGGRHSDRKMILIRPDMGDAYPGETIEAYRERVNEPALNCLNERKLFDGKAVDWRALIKAGRLKLVQKMRDVRGHTFDDSFVVADEAQGI